MFSEQKDKRAAGSFSSKTTLRAQFPCPLWSFLRPHGVTIFGTLTEFTRGSFSAIASSLPEHPGAAPMLKVYGATAYRILAPVLRLGSRFWVPEVCTTVHPAYLCWGKFPTSLVGNGSYCYMRAMRIFSCWPFHLGKRDLQS